MSHETINGILALRQMHLQSIAQIWSEGGQISTFIQEHKKDDQYTWTDPTQFSDAKDSYWAKLVVETGPVNPNEKVCKTNPYLFWAQGVAPFFDANNGRYMVQPFANNRIYVSVPKRLTGPKGEIISADAATKAIASYFVSAPGLFGTKNPGQVNLEYKSAPGAKTLGDLEQIQDSFDLQSGLFVKMITRYISPESFEFNPLQQSLVHLLGANSDVETSFNLSDSSSLYNGFGAAMQNLLALIWSNDAVAKSVFTQLENMNKPGGYVPGATVQLMNELVGYDYPFFLDLVILEDTSARFCEQVWQKAGDISGEVFANKPNDGNQYKSLYNRWVWTYGEEQLNSVKNPNFKKDALYIHPKFPLQALELMVPMQPDIKQNSPVALTRYNVDSAGYPFTC